MIKLVDSLIQFFNNQIFLLFAQMTTSKPQKPPSLEDLYNQNDFIDAKDNQGDWRVGYIINKYPHSKTYKIRFDGWPSKYDEAYKFNSAKLKPFRTTVIGYTGQMQNPGIREWKYSQEDHIERMRSLLAVFGGIEKYSVHDFNQLMRGHNYFYVDFLMTWKFQSAETITPALDFFFLNIKLLISFLHHLNSNFEEFVKIISSPSQLSVMTIKQAYYMSFYEIFDCAYIISGGYPRLSNFFRDNGDLIKASFKDETKRQAKRTYQLKLTKMFGQQKGLQLISSIVNHLLNYEQFVPFLFLQSLTNLYNGLSSIIGTQDKQPQIDKLIKIGQSNIKKIKDHHLKDLHKHHVSNFLAAIVNLTVNTNFYENIEVWKIELELELALKMILCPYFERKLKGIAHITTLCEKSIDSSTTKLIKKWINKTNLFQTLFTNNDNQQFIKKACQLVKILNIKGYINDQDIQLIWSSRLGKHQTTIREIYQLISDIPLHQTQYQRKLQLFNKISTVQPTSWDEDYIKMIKKFTENSYGYDIKQHVKYPFGFYIVYRYAVMRQTQFSLELITNLLHKIEKSKVFQGFQEECFKCIENGDKAEIHIRILLIIINNRMIDAFENLTINYTTILINFLIKISSQNNEKVIADTLQLLGQIIKSTNKTIQINELMILWNTFTKSTHKQLFMKWLYKKRDNGRIIINQALNQQHRSHLLTHLWNTEQQITAIQQNQTIFLIQLFKTVNTFHQKMKRYNIIIRPQTLQLQHYNKFWLILKYSPNPKVITLISDFISQINTSYQQQNLQLSITKLVDHIVGQIKASIEDQNIEYISKLLILTQKLILRDQEIFNYQSIPKINYVKEYNVVYKDRNQEKNQKFNCMSTLYEFKKLIAEKWSIPIRKLIIYNNKQQAIALQSYFKTMNQNNFINNTCEIAEKQEEESFVKNCINRELQLFFSLLDDKRIEKAVWNIVQNLPISDELKFRILQTDDILQELQTVGFYKELYELKVILQLPQEWWEKFSSSRNLQILVDSLNKAKFQSHIQFQYLSTLTDSISKVLNISNSNSIQITIPEDLPQKIMHLLKDFMNQRHSQQSKSIKLELKLLKNLFSIIESLKIFVGQDYIYAQLLDNPQLQQIFTIGLISVKQVQLRKKFNEELKSFISDCKSNNWNKLLHLMLKKLLRIVVGFEKKENLKEYFDFTTSFLDKIPEKYVQQFIQSQQGEQLCDQLFQLIQKQTENINIGPNIVLVGYLALLRYLIPYESKELMLNISDYILFQCLFSDRESKCKSKKARWEALNLLRTLFINAEIIEKVTTYLSELLKKGKWRTRKLDDWTITLYDKMKSNTGYVGLKNLGCICYMNSFMQQLYMIPYFRNSIISCRDPLFTSADKEQNLLYQIQKMFLNLQNSDRKFYIPKQFCNAFKDYDGNPTNVSQQMDIDQFSNILFDRVQNQLKPTKSQTLIKDMFGGVFSNQIVCKGCPHYSQTQQHFLSISLTVKKNIYQSFDTMIKGDTLDGDNAYFCERCNKKVSAVKRVSLKKLPDHLIITLKRFQFDYQKMMKLKLNDYCQFPSTLNLQQYSRQYLRKQQNTKATEDEQDEGTQYYNYVLKGVVVHIGSADSGHYYSFIQDRATSKWYEFNDTVVRDFDIEDLPDEAFGGESSRYDQKQRIKNAYMLIYQREKKRNIDVKKQEVIDDNPIRTSILEEIAEENKEQKIQHALFSPQYSRFVSSTIDNLEQYDQVMQKQVLKFSILSYLTISVRQKSQSEVYSKLKKLSNQLRDHQDIKEWVLRLFSQNEILNQFMKNNLIRDIRRLLSYWLLEIFSECSPLSQEMFCNLLINKLTEQNENILDYCLMLYEISKQNAKHLDYIISKNVIGRMIENIIRKQPRFYVQKLQTLPYSPEQLGREILIERPQTDQSKKLRLDNENGYIWGIINLAISRAKQLKIDLEAYISKLQQKYIWLNQNKIYKILQEVRSKMQMYQFLNLLAYLSKGNKQFLQTLIDLLNRGLKQFQSKRYRQFFLLFQKLLHVQDENKHLRINAFQKLIDALMHNQQYTLDSNIIQQWILILINRNEQIRTYLSTQPKIIDYLQKVATKKTPNEQFARKNNTYAEYMINKHHGVKFPKSKKGYTKLAQNISSFYQQILETKFTQSLKWPYFPQTQSSDFKADDTIAYFDSKDKLDYEQAKIQSISFSRLQLHLKRNRILNIWKDDEKLSFDTRMIISEEDIDLNSSRTTQMDIDEDELFDDI